MKKGISLVALIITIIVLIILTAAVVMTGINTPQNAQLAVFKNNVSVVQEAITLKMLNNLTDASVNEKNAETYKWVGVVQGYIYDPTIVPTFSVSINGINTAKLSDAIKENINISEADFDKYYIDSNGVVYYYDITTQKGFEYNGEIYYNATTKVAEIQEEEVVELESIEITTASNQTTYIEGDIFNTEGMVVTAMYINETTEVISNYTVSPSVALTLEDTLVTITYEGKTATQAIIVNEDTTGLNTLGTTLGEIIRSGKAYGTTVHGYSANGYIEWYLLYYQEINEQMYCYIIPNLQVNQIALPLYSGDNASNIIANAKLYFGLSDNFDTVSPSNNNYKSTLWLLDTSLWNATYKTGNALEEYIQDVIGSITMEMLLASYNAKTDSSLSYTVNSVGYSDPGSISGVPYVSGYYWYWLACPTSESTGYTRRVTPDGDIYGDSSPNALCELRPVVCLKANIPASLLDGEITLAP